MDKLCLNSEKDIKLSLKPSKAICLLLMVLFVGLFANVGRAQTTLFDCENSINPHTVNVGKPVAVHNVTVSGTIPASNNNIVANPILLTGLTKGQVVDAIVANTLGCTAKSTGITNTVDALPTIITQPINQLDCEGSIVSFEVVAGETGLMYTWQRKRPTDFSFITIPVEANVSYPSAGKIRLQNVGGALSPNGTQYQVIVSNGTSSETSSVATLSVNEITGITPVSTTVVRCYGTNYSYTVSTSYSANVVSYQWKSSAISGIWNNVVNGTNFSGATTATLNIIGGTPAETAEYRVYITFHSSGADCNVDSASRTRSITFLPELLTPVTAVTQPTCTTATGTITVTVQSASDTYSFDNGLTFQPGNSKSGLAAGSYNIIIKNIGGCTSVATSTTVNVQAATPVQPILSAVTQPTCTTSTGSFTITNYNADYSYIINPSTGVTVSGSVVTAPMGSYTVTAMLDTCTSILSTGVTINAQVNTWNGTVWSTGFVPTSAEIIIFEGNYSSSSDLVGCSCQVNSGTVIINSGYTLTLTNEIEISGGSLVFEDGASLVQINDNAVNTGSITYRRITVPIRKTDYTYWSSPVVGYTLGGVSPNTSLFYSFDINNWKKESAATIMSKGIGYIVRGPQNYDSVIAAAFPAFFVGVPNSGAFSLTDIDADKLYLLGNPYPSALDADKFLTDNSSVLDGTLYFWTHNTAIQLATNITNGSAGSGTYAYTSDDYASYNFTGGVGTVAALSSTNPGAVNTNIPSGKIASGQSFFTTSSAAGAVIFNNGMRVGVGGITGNNSQFFKINATTSKTTKAIEKHRVWLSLTNAQGAFKQTLVGYITNATNEYENSFDGESFDGNKFIDFYSIVKDKKLAIQGRVLPFDENDEVQLGYSSAIKGTFSIAIDQVDGLLVSQDVFIEDKSTTIIHNLKQGAYSFSTEVGTFKNRFVLRYTNAYAEKTLGTSTFETSKNIVLVSNKNKQIKINSSIETIKKVQVFDLLGKLIYQKININNNELAISDLKKSNQVVLVKIVLQNGKTVTNKIVY